MGDKIIVSPIFYDEEHVLRSIKFVNNILEFYKDNSTISRMMHDYQFNIVVADMYERLRDTCEDQKTRRMANKKNAAHLNIASDILDEAFYLIAGIK